MYETYEDIIYETDRIEKLNIDITGSAKYLVKMTINIFTKAGSYVRATRL
jgi:hypothetical protein